MGTAAGAVLEEGAVTTEDRFVIDLSDLREVRFECSTCGAALSFKIDKWKDIPSACPGCNVQWHLGPHTDEHKTLSSLCYSMRGARALADTTSFRLRFELVRPKT